jgi:hypothetical protein
MVRAESKSDLVNDALAEWGARDLRSGTKE